MVDVIDEHAAHRPRQEVRDEQRVSVHGGAPRLADGPRRREAPRQQAAEDVDEGVVVQIGVVDGA